jgi:hypothetical protein
MIGETQALVALSREDRQAIFGALHRQLIGIRKSDYGRRRNHCNSPAQGTEEEAKVIAKEMAKANRIKNLMKKMAP